MSQASGRPITAEELLRLADGDLREQIEERDRLAEIKVGKADRECEQHKPRPSQATMLVELASQASACLFHAADGEAYAGVTVGGHHETHRLKAKSFRRWLTREFHIVHGKAPSGQALRDALAVLERRALYDGPEQPVAVRLAGHGDAIYLDLADRDWRAVEVATTGWRIITHAPVKFIRPRGVLPLPLPVTGGQVTELRQFVNVAGDAEWQLLVAWLVAALRPRGPYPVLVVHGEQGSAKSTTAKILRALIDPNAAPLRSEPREPRELMIAATNSWIIALDNLSHLPPWLSDALCRMSTGGGFATRELFSDAEEVIFDAQRPVILTGIEEVATRSDLLDRAIVLHLPPLPEDRCRPEAELLSEFEVVRPRILGALLDAVAGALRELPRVKLKRLPRMADFAKWVSAAEPVLRWERGSFLAAYTGNRSEANELALDSALIVAPLRALVECGPYTGTAAELLERLTPIAGDRLTRAQGWPRTPRALSGQLRRLAPNLRRAGITVELFRDSSSKRQRLVRLERVRDFASEPSEPSEPSEARKSYEFGIGRLPDSSGANRPIATSDRPAQNPANTVVSDGSDGSDGYIPDFSDDHGDAWEGP